MSPVVQLSPAGVTQRERPEPAYSVEKLVSQAHAIFQENRKATENPH
jgi:hypothetical protein